MFQRNFNSPSQLPSRLPWRWVWTISTLLLFTHQADAKNFNGSVVPERHPTTIRSVIVEARSRLQVPGVCLGKFKANRAPQALLGLSIPGNVIAKHLYSTSEDFGWKEADDLVVDCEQAHGSCGRFHVLFNAPAGSDISKQSVLKLLGSDFHVANKSVLVKHLEPGFMSGYSPIAYNIEAKDLDGTLKCLAMLTIKFDDSGHVFQLLIESGDQS